MDVISLQAKKDNIFDLTLDVQGLDNLEGLRVRLIIKIDNIHYGFDCDRVESSSDKFTVTISGLSHVKRSAYPYVIEVVVDGYHFNAAKGTANFINEPFVGSSKPVKTDLHTTEPDNYPPVKPAVPLPESKRRITNHSEKPIAQIAEEIMEKQRAADTKKVKKTIKTDSKIETKDDIKPETKDDNCLSVSVDVKKDKAVAEALKSLSIPKLDKITVPNVTFEKLN